MLTGLPTSHDWAPVTSQELTYCSRGHLLPLPTTPDTCYRSEPTKHGQPSQRYTWTSGTWLIKQIIQFLILSLVFQEARIFNNFEQKGYYKKTSDILGTVIYELIQKHICSLYIQSLIYVSDTVHELHVPQS